MLRPILEYFLRSFKGPASPAVKDFWGKIARYQSGGSGPTYFLAWITAFCFWDEKGQNLSRLPDRRGCALNGVLYHRVANEQIPSGYVSAPVTLSDNGKIHHAKMLARSVGIQASRYPGQLSTGTPLLMQTGTRTGDATHTTTAGSTQLDTLQPVSGWWMLKIDPDAPDPETQHKLREQKQSENIRMQLEDSRKRCDQGVQ